MVEYPRKLFIRTCRWLEHTTRAFRAFQTSYGRVKRFKVGLVSELKPIREGMTNLSKTITFPQFPSITADDDEGEEKEDAFVWDIVEQYLRKFASTSGTNKTFGLRDKDGKFYMGKKEAKIRESNIIVGDKEYIGTPGLWEPIVATTPDDKNCHQ